MMDKANNYPKYLFHGTDEKVFILSDEGLQEYMQSCKSVIKHLAPFYVSIKDNLPSLLVSAGLSDERARVVEAASRTLASICRNDILFRYGDLYLSSILAVAWNYALNSYGIGELGTTCYNLIIGAEILQYEGWDNDTELQGDIEMIKAITEIPASPMLLIFPFDSLELQFLHDLDSSGSKQLFRYSRPLDLYHYSHKVHLPANIQNPMTCDPSYLQKIVQDLIDAR